MAATQELLLGEGAGGPANYIEDVFSTYLYTGTGANQTITNNIDLSTKGGMVWTKGRSAAQPNSVFDTVRGATNQLVTNTTAANNTAATSLTAFNTNGFSLGIYGDVNSSGTTMTSWTFRKQPKFFDVVTYTGDGNTGARAIAHNLGSVPGCIFIKCTSGTTASWVVYHRSLGATQSVYLNTTAAAITFPHFGNTSPTSTDFYVSANSSDRTNFSGYTYVAYLFAHDAGGFGLTGADNVISCSSFTTDGSGNATASLGYEPQWVIVKRTDSSTNGDWLMLDTMRGWSNTGNVYAGQSSWLYANLPAAEDAAAGNTRGCPTATGFTYHLNASATYIYIAIRRGPMKVPTAGTTVYNTDTFRSTTANPNWKFNFVTDMSFSRVKNSAQDWGWKSRLTGATGLISDSTAAEYSDTNITWDFMNGVGISTSAANPQNYGWGLKRSPSFFDVVCYTGTQTDNTQIAHNLGVAPELIITKKRSSTGDWWTLCTANATGRLGRVNTTGGLSNSGIASVFGDGTSYVAPTTSVFTLGSGATSTNTSGATYIAYLFATCAGVSKVGSYTGNATLTTINCGFTGGARFVMIKRTDTTSDWFVWDTSRGMVAGTDPMLPWNATTAEANANSVYTVTTGFQLLASPSADVNTNGGSYIYLAIA